MSNVGLVYFNDELAGKLSYVDGKYSFTYDQRYLDRTGSLSISFSFPKRIEPYTSPVLFPFFSGLLSEGENKGFQCAVLKIDEADLFTRLLLTAGSETIGAVTVREA